MLYFELPSTTPSVTWNGCCLARGVWIGTPAAAIDSSIVATQLFSLLSEASSASKIKEIWLSGPSILQTTRSLVGSTEQRLRVVIWHEAPAGHTVPGDGMRCVPQGLGNLEDVPALGMQVVLRHVLDMRWGCIRHASGVCRKCVRHHGAGVQQACNAYAVRMWQACGRNTVRMRWACGRHAVRMRWASGHALVCMPAGMP